jgi:cytosine/adenosine deaminase-related metal-dependent hydrolase
MTVTSIHARFVVGHDGEDHCLVPDGEVVFRGDTVLYVGTRYPGAVERRIDAGNAVIGPGFIDLDALADLDSTVLAFDNHPTWATGRIWSADYVRRGPRDVYTPEEEAFKMEYAFVQLLRNGITTAAPITSLLYRAWAETAEEFSRVADIAGRLGLRVYLGPAYRSGLTTVTADGRLDQHWDEARGLAGLERAVAFVRTSDGAHGGLVRGMLAPDRVETCTPRLLRETAAAAEALECPVRLHCCQSNYEVETVQALRGRTPLRYIHEAGLLGRRALLPHGVFLASHSRIRRAEGADEDLLAASGATLVHCPLVMFRQGHAMESFARLRRRGINIALGTDTYPPDLLENMRVGIGVCRLADQAPDACSAADFYRAATLGGAAALGRPDLGRLAPGAKADITVFDLDHPQIGQLVDPIQTMILNGIRGAFVLVVVNGRIVMEGGEIPGVDCRALHARAQRQFEKLMSRVGEWTPGNPPRHELFRPSFPVRTDFPVPAPDAGAAA